MLCILLFVDSTSSLQRVFSLLGQTCSLCLGQCLGSEPIDRLIIGNAGQLQRDLHRVISHDNSMPGYADQQLAWFERSCGDNAALVSSQGSRWVSMWG